VIQDDRKASIKISKEKKDEKYLMDFRIAGNGRDSLCIGPGSQAQLGYEIDNFSFGPATITIPAGSTVTWTNNDDVPHVVTSDDNKMFKSKALDTDDRFSFTFKKPGTYNYYCAVHPKMTAKIVVR
jgi:plastocyanin